MKAAVTEASGGNVVASVMTYRVWEAANRYNVRGIA